MESKHKKKKTKKKMVIDPTERQKISLTQAVNDIEFTIDSASENNSDDETHHDTNDSDDE